MFKRIAIVAVMSVVLISAAVASQNTDSAQAAGPVKLPLPVERMYGSTWS